MHSAVLPAISDAFYSQAHNESAQALDFVSLLLSQHAPQQAQQTLNPYIKNALPLGVLGTGRVQPPQKMDAQKDTDSMMAIGWKMQSLDSAADLLLKSATRLELELERETRYWERVLAVKQQGWSVCRLPREKHTLSVKYGFSEGTYTLAFHSTLSISRYLQHTPIFAIVGYLHCDETKMVT